MLSFINFLMVFEAVIWFRDFAVIFAFFTQVCRVFAIFRRNFLLSLLITLLATLVTDLLNQKLAYPLLLP